MATVKQLLKIAEEHNLIRKCRNQPLVYKRYYIFNELRKELTLEAIARLFQMNHSTVLYGLKQHDLFMRMNDRIYINIVSELFQKVNEFAIDELDSSNMHMKIINDEDSFITIELYINTKHADIYRENQGMVTRELFKEML